MASSHEAHKVERVTITLVPEGNERSFFQVPSTFNRTERTYTWQHHESLTYMLVPTKISSKEIKVDLIAEHHGRGKASAQSMQQLVQAFVKAKIHSEWRGLRLESISRPTTAAPPERSVVRGTIEEILGTSFES